MSGESLPSGVPDWLHLKPYGYALGNYMNECHTCGHVVQGVDKRAVSCRTCAEAKYLAALASPPPQATGAQPHPEPSEEASSLPVVAWFASGELYHTKDGIPFRHLPPVGEIHALVLLSVAQSQLNAMRAELAAAREHLARSEGLLAIAIKQNENADRRALKAAQKEGD